MDHSPFDELSLLGWLFVGAAVVVAIWSLWLSVRWTMSPGETEPDHPKRSILDDDAPPPAPPGRVPGPDAPR